MASLESREVLREKKNSNRNLRWLGKEKWDVTNYRERRVFLWALRLLLGLHTKAHPVVKSNKTHRAQRTKREGDYKPVVTTHPFPSWQVCVHTCKCPWCESKWAFNETFKALLFRLWRGSLSLLFWRAHADSGREFRDQRKQSQAICLPNQNQKTNILNYSFTSCVRHMSALPQQFETPLAHDTLLQPEKSQITEKYNKINPTHPSLTSDCFVKKHLLCLSEITRDSSPASSIANESTSI